MIFFLVRLFVTIVFLVPSIGLPAFGQDLIVLADGKCPKRLPKNSTETLYLSSALGSKPHSIARVVVAPKPTPTPKAKPAEITIRKGPVKPISSTPSTESDEYDDIDEYGDAIHVFDPIQPVNRGLFWVNHQLYSYILKPATRVYTTIIPKPLRTAVRNVYDNVEYPIRFTNRVLQLDFKNADMETRKFVVNSVGGLGGIFRLSDHIPSLSNVPSTDTGQTFAKWGIGHGPYLVLPVIGPRSVRDAVGLAGDIALNPVTWVPFGGIGEAASLAITTPNTTRNMEMRLQIYDATTRDAIDPYLSLRDAYIQSRDKAAEKK
jgi:phospholipid-binding lipoprotein MlaA